MASQPLLGAIFMFAGNFAPVGYQLCQGQLLPIDQYTAIFSLLGTNYGGNGTTNFALPDLRSRIPVGQGQGPGLSPYVLGEAGGSENVTLLATQMPQHNHTVGAVTSAGNSAAPGTTTVPAAIAVAATHPVPDFPGITADVYSNSPANTTMSPTMIGLAGGNQPHTNIQPFVVINYIIAMTGIFPSRN